MTDYDIHSCGYYCNRPACIEAQRNELRDKLFSDQAVKTYSGGKPNYTQPIEPANTRILVSHDWRDIWEQFDEHSFDIDEEFQKEMKKIIACIFLAKKKAKILGTKKIN